MLKSYLRYQSARNYRPKSAHTWSQARKQVKCDRRSLHVTNRNEILPIMCARRITISSPIGPSRHVIIPAHTTFHYMGQLTSPSPPSSPSR